MARLSIRRLIHDHLLNFLRALTGTRKDTKPLYTDVGVQTDDNGLNEPSLQFSISDAASQTYMPPISGPESNMDLLGREAPFSTPIASQDGSRLLSLPSELRNMIYLNVLATSGLRHIYISPSSHELPGLLRTCRQTRLEATQFYLKENAFSFDVIDLKLIKPLYSSEHWSVQDYGGVRQDDCKALCGIFSGRADWDNLKEWLRLCYEGELPPFGPKNKPGWRAPLASVFEFVMSLREFEEPMEWEKVEVLLGPSKILVESNVKDQAGHWI